MKIGRALLYLDEKTDTDKRVNRNIARTNNQEWAECPHCGGTFLIEATETDMEGYETIQGLCLKCGSKEEQTGNKY